LNENTICILNYLKEKNITIKNIIVKNKDNFYYSGDLEQVLKILSILTDINIIDSIKCNFIISDSEIPTLPLSQINFKQGLSVRVEIKHCNNKYLYTFSQ
jgi:hypothetical protein